MRVCYFVLSLIFITNFSLAKQLNVVNIKEVTSRSRKIRAANTVICTNLTSCSGRCSDKRMFHNIKDNINKKACYCDPECDKVFTDCCADYVDKCGKPKKIPAKKISKTWSCFSRKEYPFKVWMIAGCTADWPKNDSNVKYCSLFKEKNPQISWITPVFASKTTYRNRYCALCNGATKFKAWKYKKVKCKIELPKKITEEQKVKHHDKYCDASTVKFKTQTRGVRYCYDLKKNCRYYHDKKTYQDCKFGPTGLLSFSRITYKNLGCLTCNRKKTDETVNFTCGPRNFLPTPRYQPPSLVIIISSQRVDVTVNQKPRCSERQLYDNAANLCRDLFVHNASTSKNFLEQFALRLTFQQTKTACPNQIDNTSSYVRKSLVTFLRAKLQMYQAISFQNTTTQWYFHDLNAHLNGNITIITFKILRVQSRNETLDRSFLKEELNFGQIDLYDRFKVDCLFLLEGFDTTKAVCLDNKTYAVNVDDVQFWNGSIYLNTTQMEYKAGEYMLYQYNNKTRVALCRSSKPAQCLFYLQAWNESHWKEFANRSIYSMATNSWFHYGEYSLDNGSLWLCLTKDYNTYTRSSLPSPDSIHNIILNYGTTGSFSVSIISLTILFVVYAMFSPLRNLPGKNLMLFSAILALAQTSWLVQNEIASKWPGLCPTINVIMQFLFLALFSCSLSISLHSFLTFNALSKGKLRKRSKGGLFLKYSILALGLPFFYVMGCLILDTNHVVLFHYGTSDTHCWFSSTSALYIGFLCPAFFLLLCNVALFFATVNVIRKCTNASQKLAEQSGGANRKHFGIYVRISTLVGFTWLAAVFNIFCPDVIAFQYIFVFVNGFQGLYLAIAFLSTANVKKIILGRKEIDSSSRSNATIKQSMSMKNM